MRLFVALDFPDAVKEALLNLRAEIPTARWSNRAQLHLTLFFIGETERVQDVKTALETVKAPPFTLTLAGVGRFPKGDHQPPAVLWAGVENPPALRVLHEQVSGVLTDLGYEADRRPFNPHITLARLKASRPLSEADAFLKMHHDFRAGPVELVEFVLFSSELSPQGARYRREAVYPLTLG
jgi:2'-5' RNA ligase